VEEVELTNMRCTSDEEGGRWEVRVDSACIRGGSRKGLQTRQSLRQIVLRRGEERSQLSQPIINTIKCQGKAYVARGGLRSAGLRGSNAQLTAELETVLVCHL
jgi:hypothetical protein